MSTNFVQLFPHFSVYRGLQNGSKILLLANHNMVVRQSRNLCHDQMPKDLPPHQRPEQEFKVAKALIVSKLSRLELESHRHSELSEPQLEQLIRNRGADYDSLVYHHHLHKNFQQCVAQAFTDMGVKVQLANR